MTSGFLRKYCRQRPTLPYSFPYSTIGGIRLNFRVRNGNGCDPDPMTTGKLGCLGFLLRSHPRASARQALLCGRADGGAMSRRPRRSAVRPRGGSQTIFFKERIVPARAGARQHGQLNILQTAVFADLTVHAALLSCMLRNGLWSSLTAD